MSRLINAQKVGKQIMLENARRAIDEWKWPLLYADLTRVCPLATRSKPHSLRVSGVAEWEMTSGVQVRSIGFDCAHHRDKWELRQVKRDGLTGWTEVFVLHNGDFVGALSGTRFVSDHANLD